MLVLGTSRRGQGFAGYNGDSRHQSALDLKEPFQSEGETKFETQGKQDQVEKVHDGKTMFNFITDLY